MCILHESAYDYTTTGGLGNKRTSGVHPNNSIVLINQNTEKGPGDLKRVAVTQTPVNIDQQTLL